MYTFVINDENFPKTTVRKRIIEGSNLVDKIRFLVYPTYSDESMSEYIVDLEYITPITKTVKREHLSLGDEAYREYLQYSLPIDSGITNEVGDVRLKLIFSKDCEDDEGNTIRRIRRTSVANLKVEPCDCIDTSDVPESDFNIIKQKLNEIESSIIELDNSKADNISLTENGLQLTSNQNAVGNSINIDELSEAIINNNKEGLIKIVEF